MTKQELKKCYKCDSLVENKQKGIICFNANSEWFNQKPIDVEECESYTDYYFVDPNKEDSNGLFND